jgi:hypothetical protein
VLLSCRRCRLQGACVEACGEEGWPNVHKRNLALVREEGRKIKKIGTYLRGRGQGRARGQCTHATGGWNARTVGPLRLSLSQEVVLLARAGGMGRE